MSMDNKENHKHIVVVGAGVIGLTTAIRIQEAHDFAAVTIIAEHFPTDPRSIRYASLWAGADHISFAQDDERQKSEHSQ
jgi:D-amino-acid oxidase